MWEEIHLRGSLHNLSALCAKLWELLNGGKCVNVHNLKFNIYFPRSIFGSSLVESGEALKSMADLKYALDDNVKQNYLEPLHHLQSKDLKEVSHHRKKLQGRKLDYDCKKRQGVTDKELKQAEDKFAESLHLAQMGKYRIISFQM